MTVGVVVDAGASLPKGPEAAAIKVVSMHLDGDAPALDGSPPAGSKASTSAPSPGGFVEAIKAADSGDGVVVITVAERLSASFGAAHTALAIVGSDHQVRLVDSMSATTGEGLVALAAWRAARAKGDLDAVAAAARRAGAGVRLVAQIARLDRLARGGRLPSGVLTATRLTGVRPLFELRQGAIRPLSPAFSLGGAENRILSAWRRARPKRPAALHLAALYGGEPESAKRLLEAVRGEIEPADVFLAELSPLMLTHTGPGTSGLSWWWEEQRAQ